MKKFILFITFVLSIAFVSAVADLEIPTAINLVEQSRNSISVRTISIKNIGDVNLTDVTPTASVSSGFSVTFSPTLLNLSTGETASIDVTSNVVDDASTGNQTLGTIKFESNEYTSSTFPILVEVLGGLSIHDLDVTLNRRDAGFSTHTDVKDGERLDFGDDDEDEVRPGSSLEFDFRIENEFSDKLDIDIGSVSVLVTIMEIDDGEDIDDESDLAFMLKQNAKPDFCNKIASCL